MRQLTEAVETASLSRQKKIEAREREAKNQHHFHFRPNVSPKLHRATLQVHAINTNEKRTRTLHS